MEICNKDCFNCPYDDCIYDGYDLDDIAEAKRREREMTLYGIPEIKKAKMDEIAAKQRAYRDEHRDEIAAKQRAYYDEHRDEIAAKQRAYRDEHRDEYRKYMREYMRDYQKKKREAIRNGA